MSKTTMICFQQISAKDGEALDFKAICETNKLDTKTCWSWWEPIPQSMLCIEGNIHPLLRPGLPEIPEGAEIAEARLFWPHASLHWLNDDGSTRAVLWREVTGEDGKQQATECTKAESNVLLKDKPSLQAYGLDFPEEWPAKEGTVSWESRKLKLVEYKVGARCVAWTLNKVD